MKPLFIALEILGFIMIFLGLKTQGGLSVALGIGGLLIVVVSAGVFTKETPNAQEEQKPT